MDDRRAFGAPAFRVQPFQARPPYWGGGTVEGSRRRERRGR